MAVGRAEEDLHDQLLGRVARSYFVDGMLQSSRNWKRNYDGGRVSAGAWWPPENPRALYGNSSRLGYVAARYLESRLSGLRLTGGMISELVTSDVSHFVRSGRTYDHALVRPAVLTRRA